MKRTTYIVYIVILYITAHAQDQQDIQLSYYQDPYMVKPSQHDADQESNIIQTQHVGAAIFDTNETAEVDFSYYQDPYAFDVFRNRLPVKAKLSGYVQYSAWLDTRQNVTEGEGYLLLYPKKKLLDPNGKDINARGEFNMSMIETRLQAELFGPDILKAESFAYIEADVFGPHELINRWQIRHAFLQLTWEHTKLLLGQFWHPAFIVKTFPMVVSYDGGGPIAPYSRNPQLRITAFNDHKTELVIAATTQMYNFTSDGPIGFSSSYQRNAMLPDISAIVSQETRHNYIGLGINGMMLRPRIESNSCYKVDERIGSFRFFAFDTFILEPLEIRQQFMYAQNGTNLFMIGGYAVHTVDPITDERTYTNLNSVNYWIDFNINRKVEPGLFIGVAKNIGSRKSIIRCLTDPVNNCDERTVYGLSPEVDQLDTVVRVAPRIRVHVLPIDFAAELEYTRAGYGCPNACGRVTCSDPVYNLRALFTAFYYF